MNAHALAKLLLEQPDIPVVINGWGSDEGTTFEVTKLYVAMDTFVAPTDSDRDKLPERECVSLAYF